MSALNLNASEKQDIQHFVESLHKVEQADKDRFLTNFAGSGEAAWRRFIKGGYNHPITWWIGIFQLQMQMGMWGHGHKGAASVRANDLWKITQPLRDEITGKVTGGKTPILSDIVRYNFKYRKADIAGRLLGGKFTNYASTGGKLGNKNLPVNAKVAVAISNFGIASYGAGIKAIAEGHKSLDAIIQSVLTGRPDGLPPGYNKLADNSMTSQELELVHGLELGMSEIMTLSQVEPAPLPIKEFCAKPENINLKGLCK